MTHDTNADGDDGDAPQHEHLKPRIGQHDPIPDALLIPVMCMIAVIAVPVSGDTDIVLETSLTSNYFRIIATTGDRTMSKMWDMRELEGSQISTLERVYGDTMHLLEELHDGR